MLPYWNGKIYIYISIRRFCQIRQLFVALLAKWSLFTWINLTEFRQLCQLRQKSSFRQIRQFYIALLTKWSLFTWIILSTNVAKFRQIYHFPQIRWPFSAPHSSTFGGPSSQLISTHSYNFANRFALLTKFAQIDKSAQIRQYHPQNFVKSAIFVTAYISGNIS